MTSCFQLRKQEPYYDWEKFHNKPRLASVER